MKESTIIRGSPLSSIELIEGKVFDLVLAAFNNASIGICITQYGSKLYENDLFRHMIQNDGKLQEHIKECDKKLFFQDRCVATYRSDNKVYKIEAKVLRFHDERYIAFYIEETTLWNKKIEFLERVVDHLKRKCKLFKKEATIDALTQTFNKAQFEKILNQECQRSKRYGEPLALIVFDIDDFKQINDRFGHMVGDFILHSSIKHIKKIIRKSDFLVRIGGDEFAIIAPHTSSSEAVQIARKIQEKLARVIYQEIGFESVRCSFGIAQCMSEDSTSTLFKRADQALYRSKQNGKNKISLI